MIDLKGINPIIPAPFTASGALDEDSLRNFIQVAGAGGVHGLTLFGIAGEYYKLSDAEKQRMAAITIDACKTAGVPAIVSVTAHATEVAMREAQAWQAAGADALMLLPPFFLGPPSAGIFNHIHAVGSAVSIPVMIQYAPAQTGVSIAPDVLQRLSNEVETLQYFKIESKPPGPYISDLIARTDGRAKIFVGNAGFQMIETMDRGAIGVMPGASMFDLYLEVYNAYMAGDRVEAFRVHDLILRMLNHIRQNVEQIIAYEKRIMARRGIIATDVCRQPTFTKDDVFDALFDEIYAYVSPHFSANPKVMRDA